MYCKHCGKELNDDANFCDGCGGAVQGETINNQTAERENFNKEAANQKASNADDVKKDSSNKVIFMLAYLEFCSFYHWYPVRNRKLEDSMQIKD